MQSTGQTSIQASQPVQLSAFITASSFGSFFLVFIRIFTCHKNFFNFLDRVADITYSNYKFTVVELIF